jgi:hypothetical protein
MFGIFKDWNKKHESELIKEHPYLEQLYMGVALTKFRVKNLRQEKDIPDYGLRNRQLTAFYLRAVEGDIRKFLDASKMPSSSLMQLVILSAGFAAIKDKDVTNDGEWGAMIKGFQEAMDNDLHWFRKRGLGYAGITGEDPEENWNVFVSKVVDQNV